MSEVFWVVDKNDFPRFPVYGKEELHSNNYIHRGVHVFIEVFGGYFILQKKAKHTENGGLLSSSVSGHVRYGESYIEAAIREAKEELGLTIDPFELEEVAYLQPCKETSNEFVKLYSYLLDPREEIIRINESELEGIIIMPFREIIDDVSSNPDKYSPAFRILLNIFITQNNVEDCYVLS